MPGVMHGDNKIRIIGMLSSPRFAEGKTSISQPIFPDEKSSKFDPSSASKSIVFIKSAPETHIDR